MNERWKIEDGREEEYCRRNQVNLGIVIVVGSCCSYCLGEGYQVSKNF